jgi:hypothetical protein
MLVERLAKKTVFGTSMLARVVALARAQEMSLHPVTVFGDVLVDRKGGLNDQAGQRRRATTRVEGSFCAPRSQHSKSGRHVSLRAAAFTLWLFTSAKVFGGAALLWWLGAPGWAIAAWLMLHLKFGLRLPGRSASEVTGE